MAHLFELFKDKALDALYQLQSICFRPSAKVKINGRSFQIIKVLGEGGFSFVYLAQDVDSGRQFALKKIRCPTGNEAVKEAMREVEAYRRFRHPNIIRILDSAVIQDPNGDGQIVYLFLPLFRRGNLQDIMNANSVNGTTTPEKQLVQLFQGACRAVRAMHTYRPSAHKSHQLNDGPIHAAARNMPSMPLPGPRPLTPQHGDRDDNDGNESSGLLAHPSSSSSVRAKGRLRLPDHADDPDDEGQGFTYSAGASIPQVARAMEASGTDVVFDGDEEVARNADLQGEAGDDIVPYAHRDIKPANIMIDDNGEAILMDFGSAIRARIHVANRQQALTQQDIAAEQSTMPYRAPELFDVKTGTTLDEKVDIWSLGCTLFAVAYGHSPFETAQTLDQGGSLAMAVMNGKYKHPANGHGSQYSEGLRRLIDIALIVDPEQRPDIHQVIAATEKVLQTLD